MSHLQLSSVAAIDAEITATKAALAAQKTSALHFVGGHGGVAKEDAVQFRLEYLKTVKKLRAGNQTAEVFIEALKKAYPDLPGAEGLKALAQALYKEQ